MVEKKWLLVTEAAARRNVPVTRHSPVQEVAQLGLTEMVMPSNLTSMAQSMTQTVRIHSILLNCTLAKDG